MSSLQLDLIHQTLTRQYGAALKMLDRSVMSCAEEPWTGLVGQFPFWHVAYHALFYTDFYLSPDEAAFQAQEFHRKDYQVMGSQPWPPYLKIVADQPYDKQTIRGYLRHCARKVVETIGAETSESLGGESGFEWLKFTRLEAHLYNIRHIQHHTGQLCAFLRRTHPKGIGWVGSFDPGEFGWKE